LNGRKKRFVFKRLAPELDYEFVLHGRF
jgi:hypothetical protein